MCGQAKPRPRGSSQDPACSLQSSGTNPWFAKIVVLLAFAATVLIRGPHGRRNRAVKIAETRQDFREVCVITLAWIGVFAPLVWVWTPWLNAADFRLYPVAFVAGTAGLIASLWLFYRAHADLGTNWSITLQVRESHRLVTAGVYRRIRHPMYLSLLLYGVSEALVIPNWIAGPFYAVAMTLVFAFRLKPEEQMMRERFKGEYDGYARRTKRLFPGIW